MYQLSSSVTWKKLVKLTEKNSNDKISDYFKIASDHFKKLKLDGENIEQAFRKYKDKKVYFLES